MAIQQQIQHQPRRHRQEDSVSTFPERRVVGGTGPDGTDEILTEIDRQLAEQDRLRLGHIAIES